MALSAYRLLLRSTRLAFAGTSLLNPHQTLSSLTFPGDAPLLNAARAEASSQFRAQAHLVPSSPECVAAVRHATEVAQILKANVVQGKKVEEDGQLYSECDRRRRMRGLRS